MRAQRAQRDQNAQMQPDWGDSPQHIVPSPQQPSPVHHPHAPVEIPPDSPTTPPMPERLPIGDPMPGKSGSGGMSTRWYRHGEYF